MKARCLIACLIVLGVTGCSTMRLDSNTDHGLFQQPSVHEQQATLSGAKPVGPSPDYGFIWPVKTGDVSSFFGDRRRDYHEGIDIHVKKGTPIYASKEGVVIYSSQQIRGYGNMIVIKHPDDTATVYAHNQRNIAKKGMEVGQGELIAFVGATGKATGPHLHFEIRKNELPQDPLQYLPKIRTLASRSKLRSISQVSGN